jgi:hypothetical protein
LTKGREHSGYVGPAELVWGSWIIEGTANIRTHSSPGASPGPEGASRGLLVGAFDADSETEAVLLSSLASALGQPYTLRWQDRGRLDELEITMTAKHGNRFHFEACD